MFDPNTATDCSNGLVHKRMACMHMYAWLSNGQFDQPMNISSCVYVFLSESDDEVGEKNRKIRKKMKEMGFRRKTKPNNIHSREK